jgi:hypothetical protein
LALKANCISRNAGLRPERGNATLWPEPGDEFGHARLFA